MKNYSNLFAGLVGGLLVLFGNYIIGQFTGKNVETIVLGKTESNNNVRFANGDGNLKAPVDFSAAAEEVMPAVVNVTSITQYKARTDWEKRYMELFGAPDANQSTGSGVIISNKGYIVTNNHVIKGATEVEVTLFDKRKFKAKVIGADPSTDLAVLKISADDLPTIELANSDDVKIGEWVLAVGNPFELNFTVTAGIISAKGRNINILGGQQRSIESFIQTDAAVNPGNSGGALVDVEGRLIGINTAIATPTGTYAGYSFAVPINLVKKVVSDLMEFGEVKRGYLGVIIQEMNSDVAKRENISVNQGVLITELVDGGAAQTAGAKVGDVIMKVNGITTKSVPELQEQIGSRNPGDQVTLTVHRNGSQKELNIKLKE
jgi:Do/DeqQ family serine protease